MTLYDVIGQDSINHIRISAFGKTLLGRIISPEWRREFFIPNIGEFISPPSFVAWLKTGDDRLRTAEHTTGAVRSNEELIMYAKYYQLRAMRALVEREWIKNTLPLYCYFVFNKTGVTEMSRLETYTKNIPTVIECAISKKIPDWESLYPGLLSKIDTAIKKITGC